MNNQSTLIEYFNKLPPSIQEIVKNSGWEKKIREIVKKYSLRVDQGQAIENDTLLTMIGVIRPNEYLQYLIDDAEITLPLAEKIVSDIEKEVFNPIQEELIKLTGDDLSTNDSLENTMDEILENKEEIKGQENLREEKKEEDEELDAESLLKEIEDDGNHLLPETTKKEENPSINIPIKPIISSSPVQPPTPPAPPTQPKPPVPNISTMPPAPPASSNFQIPSKPTPPKPPEPIKNIEKDALSETYISSKNSGVDPYRESFN